MLSASTKQGRDAIAREFVAVAEKFGASVERMDTPAIKGMAKPAVILTFALGPIQAMVDIDTEISATGGIMSWYPGENFPGDAGLSPGFLVAVGDPAEANRPYRTVKATSHGGWLVLAAYLQAGLRHIQKGTALSQCKSTTLQSATP